MSKNCVCNTCAYIGQCRSDYCDDYRKWLKNMRQQFIKKKSNKIVSDGKQISLFI